MSEQNLPGLVEDLYDVVGLLRRRSRRLVGAPLPELALSGAQLELMRVVRRNPGVTVAEAARVLGLAPNTVSTLVGQLVALEVLVRTRDLADRRLARLELTPPAREGLEQWRDRRSQATAAVLAQLSPDERAGLAAALPTIARIATGLPETLDPARAPERAAASALVADSSLSGAPLGDTPLADTPLAGSPLADIPVAGSPRQPALDAQP